MSRIPLTSGFQIIPEGEYIFRIYDVSYDENFGKMVVKMITSKGQKHTERFGLKDSNDQWNENALNAFSFFAKTALNDFEREDIDPAEMVGHYIRAEIVHTHMPSKNDPTKTLTFANLGREKSPADGFEEEPTDKVKELFGEKDESKGLDLDALLNE